VEGRDGRREEESGRDGEELGISAPFRRRHLHGLCISLSMVSSKVSIDRQLAETDADS
jgi:hypothetical protein